LSEANNVCDTCGQLIYGCVSPPPRRVTCASCTDIKVRKIENVHAVPVRQPRTFAPIPEHMLPRKEDK